ncbi:MAG: heme peroxidase family protein [Sulfitobacter sp.]
MSPDDLRTSNDVKPTPEQPVFRQPENAGAHGHHLRNLTSETLDAASVNGDPGKFGRMFGHLPPLVVPDAPLLKLAEAMVEDTPKNPSLDNPQLPAGFTYFGQFVDHDITLDTTPLAQQKADPMATENFRTPALDLDSVYGQGRAIDPHLYARRTNSPYGPSNKFLVGTASPSPGQGIDDLLPNDLPRNSVGRALIGDERNDENLVVSQTHLAFLKFHNAVIDHLDATRPDLTGDDQFQEARRIVTWHYQWIVLFDWVERLTEDGIVRRVIHHGRQFYRFPRKPYMPAEFSVAAFRLGHSMIREQYDYNRVFREGGLTPATLALLFGFTGKSGAIVGDLVDDPNVGDTPGIPGGKLRDLPGNWVIDWRRFYELADDPKPNLSRALDTLMAPTLSKLPGLGMPDSILAFRNLRRGSQVGLPSGQAVAGAMGVPALTPDQIGSTAAGDVAVAQGLHKQSPLWFYILAEAEVLHGGKRLGPVGSTIIAETFVGLIHGDHSSFLWQRKNWQPELPSAVPGTFTMADMLRFTDDINPIGEGT